MKYLRHGSSEARMDSQWCDLVKRNQHECALGNPRMRNLEACLAQTEVAEHQDIQVKCTRAVGNAGGAVPLEVALDREQGVEQGTWSERSFDRNNCIDEARLTRVAHRFGGVECRAGDDAAQSGEPVSGGGEGQI